MLNLIELQKQIQNIDLDEQNLDELHHHLDLALEIYGDASRNFDVFKEKVNASKATWLYAKIDQPLKTYPPHPTPPPQYTVLATDGSQIFPSHHEIVPYYLVNIGHVVIHYGIKQRAKLWSTPYLYYELEDRFIQMDQSEEMISISSDEVSAKRDIMELEALADLVETETINVPAVAISDGPLIKWHLKNKVEPIRDDLLDRLQKSLERIQLANVALIGYMGDSRHSEFMKSLRSYACPEDDVGCDNCRMEGLPSDRKCHQIRAIRDGILFANVLKDGERSSIFKSTHELVTQEYGDHDIDFFYINVGMFGGHPEIARIEFPRWVSKNETMLNLIHRVILDQAKKGRGYPLALSEAHEQAVVRGPDRELFYQLIENIFNQRQIYKSPTRKALSKRRVTI